MGRERCPRVSLPVREQPGGSSPSSIQPDSLVCWLERTKLSGWSAASLGSRAHCGMSIRLRHQGHRVLRRRTDETS